MLPTITQLLGVFSIAGTGMGLLCATMSFLMHMLQADQSSKMYWRDAVTCAWAGAVTGLVFIVLHYFVLA